MKCEIKYFGMISEKLGMDTEWIDFGTEISDKEDLKKSFILLYQELANMSFNIAVDGVMKNSYTDGSPKLIALLPPFAGG